MTVEESVVSVAAVELGADVRWQRRDRNLTRSLGGRGRAGDDRRRRDWHNASRR